MGSSVNDLHVLGWHADYPHIEQSLSTYWETQMTLVQSLDFTTCFVRDARVQSSKGLVICCALPAFLK